MMIEPYATFAMLSIFAANLGLAGAADPIRDLVVNIVVTQRPPNPFLPWTNG